MYRISTYLCMTKDIGVDGNLFGGTMLAWLDEAAGIFAHEYTGVVRMVTVKYTELVFEVPVRVGDIVAFYAKNPRIGRTSLTFDLEGHAHGRVVIATTATFVSVGQDGKPAPIPEEAKRSANFPEC